MPPSDTSSVAEWTELKEGTFTQAVRLTRLRGSTGVLLVQLQQLFVPTVFSSLSGAVTATPTVSAGEVVLSTDNQYTRTEGGSTIVTIAGTSTTFTDETWVVFADQQTEAWVNVTVAQDTVYEEPELAIVCLVRPAEFAEDVTTDDNCGVLRVVDDGDAGVIGLRTVGTSAPTVVGAQRRVEVSESDGTVEFELFRDDQFGDDGVLQITVAFRAVQASDFAVGEVLASAELGTDVELPAAVSSASIMVVTMASGERSKAFTVTLLDDALYASCRCFAVLLCVCGCVDVCGCVCALLLLLCYCCLPKADRAVLHC